MPTMDTEQTEALRPPSVWRNRDFRLFWTGQTTSQFGTYITELALPLAAILLLDAGPAELGLLGAARYTPLLVLPPLLGVLVDRGRRRRFMIIADLIRAVSMAGIIGLALTDHLTIALLCLFAAGLGGGTVLFNLGMRSMMPDLLPRGQLVAANTAIQSSESAAQTAGPGIGGLLVSTLGAAGALIVDFVSYLVSALGLSLIRHPDRPAPIGPEGRQSWRADVAAGFRFALGNPVLRAMTMSAFLYNLFETAYLTLLLLFATRELDLTATEVGGAISAGGIGALAGSVLAGRIARRFGHGGGMIAGSLLACLSLPAVALADGSRLTGLLVLGAVMMVNGFGLGLSNVLGTSIRQALTPNRMMARSNAASSVLVTGGLPLGSLLGGFLGDALSLRTAVVISAFAVATAVPWEIFSPLPRMRELPEEPATVARDTRTVADDQQSVSAPNESGSS